MTTQDKYIKHYEEHGKYQITDLKELAERDFESMLNYVNGKGYSDLKRFVITDVVNDSNVLSYDTFEEAYDHYMALKHN